METVLVICAVLSTLAIVLIALFLVVMLIQARRTAQQAEMLFKSLNQEIDAIKRITENISSFSSKLSSPIFSLGTLAASFAAAFFRHRKKESSEES